MDVVYAGFAYMDVGKGRAQDAEALQDAKTGKILGQPNLKL